MTSGRLIALFALVAVVLGVSAQSPELVVRLAQITHRHGARNPLPTANASFICGYTYPCGALTDVGQQMLLSVGAFVRQRYNDTTIVGEPFFPSTSYNSSWIYSRSTHLERTLQSSTSFLHSIFTDSADYFPVVYTINSTLDYLLNTATYPPVFMKNTVDQSLILPTLNPLIDSLFTYDQLVAMADEIHLTDACADYEKRGVDCAYTLYDAASSFNASGRITEFPLLMAAQPGLNVVESEWFRLVYGFNYSMTSNDVLQGSSAAQLGYEIVQNMMAYINEPTFKVYEYSAHDTTVAPLAVVFGDQGDITMLPQFATSVIAELVENTTSGEYLVRVIRGQPMLQPDGSYVFKQQPFNLKCATMNPFTPYDAEGSMCPLEHFSNFVLTHLPAVANGECIVDFQGYADLQCPNRTNMPLTPNCLTYRNRCPALACPENQVLSAVDWQCYTLPSNASNEFDVVSVAVVHNAGASTPAVNQLYTNTTMCGNLGCGELTPVGMDMMLSLGEYLQTRYNDLNVVQSPVFSSNIFDIAVTNSRARRADNNIQSTSALLAGLYPSESSFPISYNRRKLNRDLVLNAAAVPPAFLRSTMTTPDELGDLLNNLVDASFTLAELVELSNSLGIGSFYCGPEERRSTCALHIYDILNSYNANGQLADSPQLQTVLANLKPVRATYVDYVVGYNTSDPLAAQQGYVGGVLASYIAGKFSNNVPFSNNANFLWELSTDELTLSALGVALSANAADALLPQYGEAYFIELLQQRGTAVMKFRVLRGTPSIVGNNDYYTYSTTPVTIRCMTNLNNTVYEAQECNYADFMLYMNSIQAPVPQGYCNVSTTLYDRLMCPTTVAEAGNTGLFPPCKQYRSVCSEYACPANYVLSAANSQCYPIAASNAPAAARQEEEIALALREEQMGERALSRAATTKTAQLRDVVERRRERKARQVVPKKKASFVVHREWE